MKERGGEWRREEREVEMGRERRESGRREGRQIDR